MLLIDLDALAEIRHLGPRPKLVVEVSDTQNLPAAVRELMLEFAHHSDVDEAGVRIGDGEVRVISRTALAQYAATSTKGIGGAGGATLPGLPRYSRKTFQCPVDGCSEARIRIGNRASESPPTCPLHEEDMESQ